MKKTTRISTIGLGLALGLAWAVGLLLVCNVAFASIIGKGEVKLSRGAVDYFIKYIKTPGKHPFVFILADNGRWATYYYCAIGQGACEDRGGIQQAIIRCERETNTKCGLFARRRTVVWKNGINKGGKQGKIKSKWSDKEVIAKLTELGFLGGSTSTTTKETKKKEKKIAKKEPTQTQQVAEKKKTQTGCIEGDCINGKGTYLFANGDKYVGEWRDGKEHGQGTKIYPGGAKYVGEFRNGSIHGLGTYVGVHEALSIKYSRVRGCLLMQCQGLWNDANLVEYYDIEKFKLVERNNIKTQIAKKEPTIKPKEEFKPVDKDIDNDPPRIEIAEAITVDTQAYTLNGKVKDKSKIYLTIDDRQVEVKKGGRFKVERFNIDPDVAEEIKIVAIDKWNNRSEKIVKVTVKLKATEVVRTYEDLKPNSVRVSMDKNKIAIIIGVEKYKNMTECNYCNRDAKAFKAYATRALGVMPSNVISLVDSNATRGEILRAFKISLPRIASDGGKDINIFFAGHGLASESGEDLYIIPQDGDQGLLEDTAVSRVELIKLIKRVNPKSVTMFFDTCYSGQTRGEQMLVASLRGIRILDTDDIPDNFSIFTASSSKQASSHIEEIKHGMFSYYLMKGLEGKADDDNNKVITNGELIAYLKKNVSKEAFGQNREQDPMLSGNPDQVLMKY